MLGPTRQNESRSTFQDYLSTRALPVRAATVRTFDRRTLTMALIDHAPNKGIWFDPIDDLIVSIVIRSNRSRVIRDVGHGRTDFTYTPGCAFLTPPSRRSYWRFDGNPHVLHLSLARNRLQDILGPDYEGFEETAFRAARTPCFDPLVAQIAMRIWSAREESESLARSLSSSGLGVILALLLRGPDLDAAGGSSKRRPGLAPWRLHKALGEIAARDRRRSIAELADLVDLSTDHFRRAFKASTGSSPHAMTSRLRIEEAKRLLCETRKPAIEIALELGFSSASHFSTRFKQLAGMSPTAWRATFASGGAPQARTG